MKVLSLQNHVQAAKLQEEKLNELVAQCIKSACANMPSMRNVLRGDMRAVVHKSRLRKAS